MKPKQRGPWRAPHRRPIPITNRVIGMVWRLSSHDVAREGVLKIRRMRHELHPGPLIIDATVLSASNNDGWYVVLVGIGEMFDANFLAQCGVCIRDVGGSVLAESKRARRLIQQTYAEWMRILKQERKKTKELLNSTMKNGL
ncbi:MAG: hypothetical protein Q8Q94_02275 [bacterium]|nr:hypothetical protein [bacterium]